METKIEIPYGRGVVTTSLRAAQWRRRRRPDKAGQDRYIDTCFSLFPYSFPLSVSRLA